MPDCEDFTPHSRAFFVVGRNLSDCDFQTQKSKIGGFQKMAENNAKKYIIKVRGEEVEVETIIFRNSIDG